MDYNMDYKITVGDYQLALLDGVEIHKSVDILADTCTITLPGFAYNKAFRVEQQLKRGDKIVVQLGYDDKLKREFDGYLLNAATDDGSLTLNCEDALFLFRKPVKNKEFKAAPVKDITQYVIDQTGVSATLECNLPITYEKFVIANATGYDVLKKLQEETRGNIYINGSTLYIQPPYTNTHNRVRYSFQQNIESSDLKYKRSEDKRIEIVVQNTDKSGKKREVTSGTTGGDRIIIIGNGLDEKAMKILADAEYRRQVYDGYEGSVNTWLIPWVEPGDSAEIIDEDFEYKDGWYFVTAVTTTFDRNGAVRKVQLGIKLAGNG